MENGNTFICACARRYSITSFIALCITATVIVYNIYLQPSYVPHVGRQQCAWSKTKKKVLRCCETPPWLLLLADYKNTTISGRNLYILPDLQPVNRLGNRLFTYAAIFGIAWRNRRIPIWPEKNVYKNADVTRFFNLRIPVDRKNTIAHVSLISHSTWVLFKYQCKTTSQFTTQCKGEIIHAVLTAKIAAFDSWCANSRVLFFTLGISPEGFKKYVTQCKEALMHMLVLYTVSCNIFHMLLSIGFKSGKFGTQLK